MCLVKSHWCTDYVGQGLTQKVWQLILECRSAGLNPPTVMLHLPLILVPGLMHAVFFILLEPTSQLSRVLYTTVQYLTSRVECSHMQVWMLYH